MKTLTPQQLLDLAGCTEYARRCAQSVADECGVSLDDQARLGLTARAPVAMVRHRFTVWIDVPAVSGDGWNEKPDYSSAEVGREVRRALHDAGIHADVEHADTTEVLK